MHGSYANLTLLVGLIPSRFISCFAAQHFPLHFGLAPVEAYLVTGHMDVQVNWGETDGREAVERVFARSATLDGDAVVVFVRALCAVSQEELVPDAPGEPARWVLLHFHCN